MHLIHLINGNPHILQPKLTHILMLHKIRNQ